MPDSSLAAKPAGAGSCRPSASAAAGSRSASISRARSFAQMAGPGKAARARYRPERGSPMRSSASAGDNTRHGDGQASRNGPGHVHRTAHAGRRRTGRRTGRRSGSRARRPTPRSTTTCCGDRCRAPAARRRWPIRSSSCARRAPPRARCWSPPRRNAGRCRRTRSRSSRACVTHALGQEGDVRRARGRRGDAAGADDGQAQGSEGLRLHRQARAAHRQRAPRSNGTRQFTQDVQACRTCSPRWSRIRRASAPRWSSSMPTTRRSDPGRARRRGAAHRRRGARQRLSGRRRRAAMR